RTSMGTVLLRGGRHTVRIGAGARERPCRERTPTRTGAVDLYASKRERTMKARRLLFAVLFVMFTPALAICAGPVQRYALVVGANSGGSDRTELRYAISDAEHFARVMIELGGVSTGHEILLRQPTLRDVIDAFDRLTRYVNDGRRTGGRTEVIMYY